MRRTAARVSFGVKSRSRPAIAKLAARRLTSPSQGPRKGFVEVVDVQHVTAIGCGEDTEVREVGIAACLDAQPGLGRLREVHRHSTGVLQSLLAELVDRAGGPQDCPSLGAQPSQRGLRMRRASDFPFVVGAMSIQSSSL